MATTAPPMPGPTLVTLEAPCVPACAAVAKALQADGVAVLADVEGEAAQSPFATLLRRMAALAKVRRDAPAVLLPGSWVLAVPEDPALRRLHGELAAALVAALRVPVATHVLVHLDADADEAFEAVMAAPEARDVDLRGVRAWLARVEAGVARHREGWVSPFPTQIARVACPAFAADNPATLARVLHSVRAALQWTSET